MSNSKIHAAARRAGLGLLVAATLLAAAPARAERADRDKPMNIEADSLRHDDQRQISVFSGNVVMTKGTLIIRAARVEVRQDAQGFQHGTAAGAPGQRAYFRQKRDKVDEYIEGEAETIEYDGRADQVRFVGRAVMRRLVGARVNDEASGSVISYDNTNDSYRVDGQPVAGGQGGRVRAMLTPRSSTGAGAEPPATGTPAAPPAPLRPSPALSGERR